MNKKLQNIIQTQSPEIVKIQKHVYLGNIKSAINSYIISKYNITAILNVSSFDLKINLPNIKINYLHIPFKDSQEEYIINYIPRAVGFIIDCVNSSQNILVHCIQGISRSPSIVIAYLMISCGQSLYDAYHYVKQNRPIINPNSSFMEGLSELETIVGKS
jgi:protein-tyrosine phosphatase